MKLTGKRSAGNPHATFDEAEVGNVLITLSGAPVFDPTDEGELEIEHEATTPALYSTVNSFRIPIKSAVRRETFLCRHRNGRPSEGCGSAD